MPKPTFFATPANMRGWFERHHATTPELLVGFHKRHTGTPSVTWPESVDVALCFGWIDGIRRSIDKDRYSIRFTPRRPTSIWSAINVKRMRALMAGGLVTPAGRTAFEKRTAKKSGIYSYEQRHEASFTPAFTRRFKAQAAAWKFFQAQAPWYRKVCTHWVMTAKKEETRERRLEQLMSDSARGQRIGLLNWKPAR